MKYEIKEIFNDEQNSYMHNILLIKSRTNQWDEYKKTIRNLETEEIAHTFRNVWKLNNQNILLIKCKNNQWDVYKKFKIKIKDTIRKSETEESTDSFPNLDVWIHFDSMKDEKENGKHYIHNISNEIKKRKNILQIYTIQQSSI